jgi:hypothetical protein
MATSVEKIAELERDYRSAPPVEGPNAMLQLALEQVIPLIRPMLPDDPDELDQLLTDLGERVLGLRSDEPAAAPA